MITEIQDRISEKAVTAMIFQHVKSLDIYIWNDRNYPITFDGKSGRTKPWHRTGKDLDSKTKRFFNTLAANQRRVFTLEGKGEFRVLKRFKYKYETHD